MGKRMIDYEKLKLANELCSDSDYSFVAVFGHKAGIPSFEILKHGYNENKFSIRCSDVDALLEQLAALIPQEYDTKYSVGDTVWFLSNGEACSSKVEKVYPQSSMETEHHGTQKVEYTLDTGLGWFEYELYPSKLALAEFHLEKWAAIYAKESFPCEHEYTFLSGFSCVKCGEKSTRQKDMSKPSMGVTHR